VSNIVERELNFFWAIEFISYKALHVNIVEFEETILLVDKVHSCVQQNVTEEPRESHHGHVIESMQG
jgi:hypothetical protein